MAVWALADLHLSFGVSNKKMDVFGPQWIDHAQKIEENWKSLVKPEDLMLIAGDISWAMHLEDAIPDLQWIDRLPGTKVILRGNHDYWWSSLSKMEKVLPTSLHLIQNNAFHWGEISIGGARLWDTSEFNFQHYALKSQEAGHPEEERSKVSLEENEKIFQREVGRLELSLKCLKRDAKIRIAMTHYPPISGDMRDSIVASLFQKYHVSICVFGHLHRLNRTLPIFGSKNGVKYLLTACDYLDFVPLKIIE